MDFDNPAPVEQSVKQLPTRILSLDESKNRLDISDSYMIGKSQEEKERYTKLLEGARVEGENNKRFWNMLVSTIARTGYKPPQGRQTQILDLGCGVCEEGVVLSAFFGGNDFGYTSDSVKVTGIDIKQGDIDRAILDHQKPDFSKPVTTYYLPSNFQFICGDATDLDKYPQKMLVEALQKLNCDIVLNERNPYAKSLGHKEISLDRNIAIVRKRLS